MIFVLSLGFSFFLEKFWKLLFRVLKPNCLRERHKEKIFFTCHKRERERREMKDMDSANDEKETKTTSSASASKSNFDSVVVHPLVLLSVVDHFKRVDEVIHNACFFSSVFSHFLRSDFDDDEVMMMMSISLSSSLSLCACVFSQARCFYRCFLSLFPFKCIDAH